MLEEWEGRVDRLEAALAVTTKARGNVTLHPATIEGYLRDLRGTLGRDTDHARMLLQRLVGRITLRRKANRLVAEIGGNLPGLLDLEDYGKSGAGGGIRTRTGLPPHDFESCASTRFRHPGLTRPSNRTPPGRQNRTTPARHPSNDRIATPQRHGDPADFTPGAHPGARRS